MSIVCEYSHNRHLECELVIEFSECDAQAFRIADERPNAPHGFQSIITQRMKILIISNLCTRE